MNAMMARRGVVSGVSTRVEMAYIQSRSMNTPFGATRGTSERVARAPAVAFAATTTVMCVFPTTRTRASFARGATFGR